MLRALHTFGVRLLVCALLALPGTSSARWYDTGTGRFLSEDPLLADALHVQGALGSPMKLSPWLYANGNPTRYTDPDGRQSREGGSGVSLALLCEAFGDKLDFCRSSDAYISALQESGEVRAKGAVAGVSLYAGGVALGARGVALAWTLGTTLDVAQQTYADPTHVKTFGEIDYLSATLNGAQMCAVPAGIQGLQALGAGGRLFASGAMLYLSAQGLAEGAHQFAQGLEQGDAGRCTYGASMALMGVAGSQSVYGELAELAPYSRVPEWLRYNIGIEVATTQGYFPGGLPPIRVDLYKPPRPALMSQEPQVLRMQENWRSTRWPEGDEGIVYILRDAKTGEYLKTGKTEVQNFDERFSFYERAARKTGRELEVDAWSLPKQENMSYQTVETQFRDYLIKTEGRKLPWDNTRINGKPRLNRPGPGVPGTYQSSTAKMGYEWVGEKYLQLGLESADGVNQK